MTCALAERRLAELKGSMPMPLEPIRTDDELQAAFMQLRPVFQGDKGTSEACERDALVDRIDAYEHQRREISMAE